MTKCENEPKAQAADKAMTPVMNNGQFAGKTLVHGEKVAWLACAIESEGSIQLAWGKRADGYIQIVPRINLANMAQEYLERANMIACDLGFPGKFAYKQERSVKYLVWYGFKRVHKMLDALLPYMCIGRKIEIAKNVQDFIGYRFSVNPHVQYGSKEAAWFQKVRDLNGKGRIAKQVLKFRFNESSETTRHASQIESEDIVQALR